uniref:Natural cytotoxicity triggering receptor 3 isoform X5 n=1 Tax=Castor canadensis TaxID=51338 RepID=A0A8B7V1W5_CASCN|nr:natural cytotoxicity triggering receptor 3 isoform X5 [Castor canadensis]
MAWTLSLIFIMVYAGSCALWVCQLPEIHTQEGTTTLLPCSFNASQGTLAIGSVTWYRDKVALGKEDLFRQRPSWCSSFELDSMPSASSLWPWVAPSITKANVSSRVRGNGRDGRGSKRAEGGKDRHQEDNSFRTAVLRGSCHLSHQATVILEYNVLLGEPPRRDSRPQ